MKLRILSSLPLCIFIAGMPGTALAVNRTWVGTTSDWATNTNWNPAAVPGTGDALTFNDTAVGTSVTRVSSSGLSSSLTFSGTKSFTFDNFGGAGLYGYSASPLTSTSSGTQTLPYLRLGYNTDGNVTLTNNGSGLLNIGTLQKDATGKTGDIVFTGSGDFQATTLRRNGTDVANGLQKSGAGTLTITSFMSTFTGAASSQRGLYGKVAITGGTIKVTSGDQRSLGQAQTADTSWLTLNGGTLQASTNNLTIDNANTGISLGASGGTFNVDASRTLTLGGGGSTNVISGAGSLTKSGTGTLVIAGATNTYNGATIVSAGALLVNGSLSNTASVSVSANSTLGGNGSIVGTVTTAGTTSILSPGTSAGTLTLAALNVSAGAALAFELGTQSDLLAVNGNLTGGGQLNFAFTDSGGLADSTPYTLFTFGSASSLNYGDLVASGLPTDKSLDTSFGTGGWLIDSGSLQVQFIPEPGVALLGALGMLTLLRRRRPHCES